MAMTAPDDAPSPGPPASVPESLGVLYVLEDDAAMRQVLQTLFQTARVPVRAFARVEDFFSDFDPQHAACVLLDLRLPGMTGLQVLERLTAERLGVPVVMLTAYADVPSAVRAIQLGAADFIEKPFANSELVDRVLGVMRRFEAARQQQDARMDIRRRFQTLSPKETQVLRGVVQGLASKQIAAQFDVTTKTVESHRSRIMEKLGVANVAELVRAVVAHAADMLWDSDPPAERD